MMNRCAGFYTLLLASTVAIGCERPVAAPPMPAPAVPVAVQSAPKPPVEEPAAPQTEPAPTQPSEPEVPAEPPAPPTEPGERFLLLAPHCPLVAEVRLTIDGQPLRAARQRLVEELLKMADSDEDGQPTWDEVFAHDQFARLEANLGGEQNEQERNRRRQGYDRNSDGKMDHTEAERFVAQIAGGGSNVGLQSGSMQDGSTDRSRLRELLDADGDRLLSAEEWQTASQRLKLYDIDDNELLSVQELSGQLLAPQTEMTRPRSGDEGISPRALQLGPRANWASIMYSLEELYLYDGRLSRGSFGPLGSLFDYLDLDGDGRLTKQELPRLNTALPQLEIEVHFGRTGQLSKEPSVRHVAPEIAGPEGAKLGRGGFLELAGMKLQLAASDSTPQADFEMQAQRAVNDLDKDRNGYFDAEEFAASDSPNRPQFEFDDLDLDDDGKVYQSELEDYIARQQMPNINRIQINVSDLEDSFFWALDASGDGRLSPRELHIAPETLKDFDRNGDAQLTRAEIPPLVTLSVERGDRNNQAAPRITRLARPAATTTGPSWFQAMDRNADGDVSRAEFLGTQQQFQHLDHNRDRFIDPAEAASASAGAP